MEASNYNCRELFNLCKKYQIPGYRTVSKEELVRILKEKQLLFFIEMKPAKEKYYIMWFSDKPEMYSFTSLYKGMQYTGYDDRLIKRYNQQFRWETDVLPPTREKGVFVSNNETVKNLNSRFFGWYPSCTKPKNSIMLYSLLSETFYLNEATYYGFIFNYMKTGCRLEVKFVHTFFDKNFIAKNGSEKMEVVCKSKYWFKTDDNKSKHVLEDEDGNYPEWGLDKNFPNYVMDVTGRIGYNCMIEEIREQYSKFICEKDLTGRNYKMEYFYRFLPKDFKSFKCGFLYYTGYKYEFEYSISLVAMLKEKDDQTLEEYLLSWKK